MPSEKQIIANRKNGKLGGPKTRKWKSIVSRNALKHWITAKIFTDSEWQKEFDEILNELILEFEPFWYFELCLVEKMALSLYRSKQIIMIENQFIMASVKEQSIKRYIPTCEDLECD